MHFRHADDEMLFGHLKAQLFQSLQGAPTHMLTNVLRVLGRIESVAFYEGVRQGVVARAIEDEIHVNTQNARPIALHAGVYSGSFTPLVAAEEHYIRDRVGSEAEDVVARLQLRDGKLAAEPLEMPPMTLAEALASPRSSFSRMAAPAMPESAHDSASIATAFATEDAAARAALPTPTTESPPATEDDFADIIAACSNEFFTGDSQLIEEPSSPQLANDDPTNRVSELLRTDGSKHVTEQPVFIERCRDVLQDRMATGWSATNWGDVVFTVRDELKADPYSIDMQLSTPIGKAMLRSIGLFEIADSVLDAELIESMLQPRVEATP